MSTKEGTPIGIRNLIDNGHALVERSIPVTTEITPLTVRKMVIDTAAFSYFQDTTVGIDCPPNYLLHIGQVATVTQAMLTNQPDFIQEEGKYFSWGHDIGRSVDMGKYHPVVGAHMLRRMGLSEKLYMFAVSHHRWGMGERSLGNGHFAFYVRGGMENPEHDFLYDEITKKYGIASLVALIADNSKRLNTPGSFVPTIHPFTKELGMEAISRQIENQRYFEGDRDHRIELIGMEFLLGAIPYIERVLNIRYSSDESGKDIISQARSQWEMEDQGKLLGTWNEAYLKASKR